MYFDNITNEELLSLPEVYAKNFSVKLSDILTEDIAELFKVEEIIADKLYRIYPMFNTKKIMSSNPKDKIFDNRLIVCIKETEDTYFSFISDEDEEIQDYFTYAFYNGIGNNLPIIAYNGLVFLLRENNNIESEVHIQSDTFVTEYGDYDFNFTGIILDNGIEITDLSSLKCKLNNQSFEHSNYILNLKALRITNTNSMDDDNTNNKTIIPISVELLNGSYVDIDTTDLEIGDIILYDGVVSINHKKPIISGTWVDDVDLTVDETTVDVGDTITLTATVSDNHGDSVSGVTVTFKNGATTLGTASTNSSGVATYNYTTTTGGVLSLTATANSLVSDVVEVTVEGVVPSSISLISSKDILSYADGESATLTATVLGSDSNPYEGATVVFKAYKGGTLVETIGSDTTDSSGVASVSYSSKGAGDLYIQCECMNLQETYGIQDCTLYDPLTSDSGHYNWASTTTKSYSSNGVNFKRGTGNGGTFNTCEISLPSNFEAEYTYMGGSQYTIETIVGGLGATYDVSNHKTWYYYRVTTNSTQDYSKIEVSETVSAGDVFKITRESGVLKIYRNGTLKHTVTEPSSDNRIIFQTYNSTRNTTIKNLKIKPL